MIATLHRRSNTRASAPRATGTAAFAISVDGLFPDHHTGYTITSGSTQAGTLTWSATGPIGNTTFRLEVFDGYVTRASSTTFTITVANEVLTFLHPNVTGSPIMATDASGAVLWREDYQAYGERIRKESGSTSANGSNPATAPAANNRAWFTGKLHDETTGLSTSVPATTTHRSGASWGLIRRASMSTRRCHSIAMPMPITIPLSLWIRMGAMPVKYSPPTLYLAR